MSILPVYKDYFITNQYRKDGLRLKAMFENDAVYMDVIVDNRFEGYSGIVQGGILFGILDHIMWYTAFLKAKRICMTRQIEMEFLKPVLCNTLYRAQGELVGIEDRAVMVSAWIEDLSGGRYVQVKGIFREAKNLSVPDFVNSYDFSHTSPKIKEFFYSFIEPLG